MQSTQAHHWPGSNPTRVLSIDVLRGLTIALMILVNDPGDWAHVYAQLDHAEWNGFTLTDLVFPNFLFLVGASIILSLQSRIARTPSGNLDWPTRKILALHILRRAATLFAIKMLLTAFPHFHWTHLRLYGVLTRITLCYLLIGLLCLITQRARTLLTITAGLLVGYWILMRFVPVPGLGLASLHDAIPTHTFPILDPDRNLAAALDRGVNAFTQRFLHTGRLYETTRDPEGLLSTLPALATTLIGALAALWLRRPQHVQSIAPDRHSGRSEESPHLARVATEVNLTRRILPLVLAGLACLAAGLLWNPWFPINKNLWTSSYVLLSAGCSLLLLALCHSLIDLRRIHETRAGKYLTFPWLVFGSNAITAFVLSNFLVEVLLWIKVPAGTLISSTGALAGATTATPTSPTHPVTAWLWIYRHLFARHQSTEVTSLAFALAFTALCFVPNLLLYRRRLFLKI